MKCATCFKSQLAALTEGLAFLIAPGRHSPLANQRLGTSLFGKTLIKPF